MTEIQEPEPAFMELDTAKLGETLLRLPAISAMLRHEGLRITLEYVCADGGPREMEFVADILTMSTDEICAKWYGSKEHATAIATALSSSAVPRRSRS